MEHCSLDTAALAERMAAWRALDSATLSRDRTPSGAEVRYRLEPGVAARLLELVEAEAGCCPTVTFDATVTVTIAGPDEIVGLFAPG